MRLSLSGAWECALPDGRVFPLEVPGCWDMYVEEKDIAEPVRLSRHFSLATVPGARCLLRFERVSYFCEVYVNGVRAGAHEGMWDAFSLDVTDCVRDGDNLLSVFVTKPGYHAEDRFPLRQVLSGFIPDVLCTFGGIWGDVSVGWAEGFAIGWHHVRGDAGGKFRLEIGARAFDDPDAPFELAVTLQDDGGAEVFTHLYTGRIADGVLSAEGRIAAPRLWSPDAPSLYAYTCRIRLGSHRETVAGTVGFRSVGADGSRLTLNGAPLYLRGILHWGHYDREIVPTPDGEQIRRELSGIRAYGFNAIKHCLYIPTDAYLDACDRAGVLAWIELPLWQPEKTDRLEARIRREYPAILRAVAGHPCVVLVSLGCELDQAVGQPLLKEMAGLAHAWTDALVCDNSGSGECYAGNAAADADFFDYHFYCELSNLEPLIEMFTPAWRNTKPWLFGEFCDSDTIRDLGRVRRAYGVARLFWEQDDPVRNPISILKPDFTAHRHDARMASSGIGDQFDRLHALSVDHSLTHRKATLEMTRAFPEISGYNITSLRDMPLSADGMFDELGAPKFDAEAFRAVNAPIVLCPAWDLTRVWLASDRAQPRERYSYFGGGSTGVHVLLSNFSDAPVKNAGVRWKLLDGSAALSEGQLTAGGEIAPGQVAEIGVARAALPDVTSPKNLLLRVDWQEETRRAWNEWPVFVYPERPAFSGVVGVFDPAGVFFGADGAFGGLEQWYDTRALSEGKPIEGVGAVIATHMSLAVRAYAEAGGKVLFIQRGTHGALPVVFAPFWREGLPDRAGGHFLGALPRTHASEDLRYHGVATDTSFDPARFREAGFETYTPLLTRYDCRSWIRSEYAALLPCGRGCILATTLRVEGGMGKQPQGIRHNVFGRWFVDRALLALTGA